MLVSLYAWITLAIFIYATCWFGISVWLKRQDVADIAWGLGFIVIAWISYLFSDYSLFDQIITLLVTIWGLRLAIHIGYRNSKKDEDKRYAQWRKDWGDTFYLRSYLQAFLLQGLLMIVVSTPVILSRVFIEPRAWQIVLFSSIWAYGFIFESIGDFQLLRFLQKKKKPKNAVLSTGLWKYTRHPNYFGEVTQWWAIFFMMWTSPLAFFGIIGPITITFLILGVSGIPMLEKGFANNPNYNAYQQSTSAFFPLPPKS